MIDTAKPTPEEEEDRFEFEYDCEVKILGQTHTCQIGSLRWQIANKIDALEERVRELEADIAEIAKWGQPIIDMIRAGESDSIRDPWISGLETALGKHGEGNQ